MTGRGHIEQTVLKYEDIDFGNRYIIDSNGVIYDTKDIRIVKIGTSGSHGYPSVYLHDINGILHSLLLHRVVAASFIGNVKGMHVHHIDENKLNPSVHNLRIYTPNEHLIKHSRAENNATAKFKNSDVHEICTMLEAGVTHKKIAKKMSKKLGIKITVDAIDKISTGTNWASISCLYNIPHKKRETMNEFSKMKIYIGKRLAIDGLTIRELATNLGIEYRSKRYVRFEKCAMRYKNQYLLKEYHRFDNFNNQ